MNGVNGIRGFLVRLRSALPSDLRTYYHPFIYGLVGGLSAVSFQVSAQALFQWLWVGPSKSLGLAFVPVSFGVIIGTAIIAGFILTHVSKEAAGSGIPQVKAAFWRDFGYLPFRVVLAKFFGCVITIGGDSSLGRETNGSYRRRTRFECRRSARCAQTRAKTGPTRRRRRRISSGL